MLTYPTRFDGKRTGNSFLEFYAPQNVYHPGIDFNWGFGSDDMGQSVVAPASGTIIYVSPRGTNGGLGNYVVIEHPDLKVWTRYLHLEEVLLPAGVKVAQGQIFALLGDSGTTSSHLHFEVLNEKGLAYIRDWWRPYGRYPTGMRKQDVAAMWLDPLRFIEINTEITPEQAKEKLSHYPPSARSRGIARLKRQGRYT
jgi:murein DD-endopeptidase MepM/ murein hydrolase activator NlpD